VRQSVKKGERMGNAGTKIAFASLISVSLLVVGNLIGAGILALPVNTGLAGFVPSLINMMVFGAAMFYSAIVLAKEANEAKEETFNYPSLYEKYLGSFGKWIAIAANLILLYGLLVAYITGGSSIIISLFNIPQAYHVWVVLLFFGILGSIILTSIGVIEKYNTFFITLMFVSFGIIVFMGVKHIKMDHLAYVDWKFLPCAIPIVVTAFHFHNIIPTICQALKWDNRAMEKTILLGMIIGFIMNAVWILVGVGALPVHDGQASLIYAFENNQPATIPLSKVIGSPLFGLFALVFSLLAIITSFLANGMGLSAFIKDLTVNQFKKQSKSLNIALTFLPPLAISLIFPDIFIKAIDVAGGFGIVMLFGILPSILAITKRRGWRRVLAFIMLILFIGAIAFDSFQETGKFKIHPRAEQFYKDTK